MKTKGGWLQVGGLFDVVISLLSGANVHYVQTLFCFSIFPTLNVALSDYLHVCTYTRVYLYCICRVDN